MSGLTIINSSHPPSDTFCFVLPNCIVTEKDDLQRDSKDETFKDIKLFLLWARLAGISALSVISAKPNVGIMLVHRLRRWTNTSSTSGQRLVFAGYIHAQQTRNIHPLQCLVYPRPTVQRVVGLPMVSCQSYEEHLNAFYI